MIFSKRRTIGVFLTKTYAFFDSAVFKALEREGKRLNGMDTIAQCVHESDQQMYRIKEARHAGAL